MRRQRPCAAIVWPCASALTDDGRPPLTAPGVRLHDRLSTIQASVERVAEKGVPRPS